MISLILAAALAHGATAAHGAAKSPPPPAELPTIFGQKLGSPLEISKCDINSRDVPVTCWYYAAVYGNKNERKTVDVKLGDNDRPNAGGFVFKIIFELIDDKVVEIYIQTWARHEDDALAALKGKFGKPTTFHAPPAYMQTQGKTATWRTSNYVVTFDGVSSDMTLGDLEIMTADYYKSQHQTTKPSF